MDAILNYTAAEINEILAKLKAGGAATPSGDPMHYAYVAAYPGLEYDASTGLWSYCAAYGGLADLTTEEVRYIFARSGSGAIDNQIELKYYDLTGLRTNFALDHCGPEWGYLTNSAAYAFLYCTDLEVAVLSPTGGAYIPSKCQGMFFRCSKLRKIIGTIDLYYAANYATEIFQFCDALTHVRLHNVRANMDLSSSPLDAESAVYLLQNSSDSATFSVTFRADRQAIYEANADFVAAKNARANITILYQ